MTALKLLSILLTLVATASAFHLQPQWRVAAALKAKIDEAKIKDAAGHFGKYSVKEVEEIKNGAYTYDDILR